MREYQKIGLIAADVLLPKKDIDLRKWAVIACDQHTSNPDYWKEVVAEVNQFPSTFNLVLPEVYLKTAQLLEVDPIHCLAIEDSFFGVIAAKSARMKVVAMPDPGEFDQARYGSSDLKISSLREINEETFDQLQKL